VYDVFSIANHIKKTGDAMAGALTNIDIDGTELVLDADGDTSITADTDDQIDIKTGGSDRVIIDSSGNVLVGRTSTISGGSNSASGAQIGSNGLIQAAVSGDTAIALQRLSGDGDIIQFRKDTTLAGSIGSLTSGRDLHVNSSGGILTLESNFNSTERQVVLGDSYFGVVSNDDNAVDLGRSVARYKNLYLSGGIYVGGTGSANYLDDYEEGIHNAVTTTTDDTSTALGITQEDALQYVKIGSMVYIHGSIAVGSTSATGAIRVSLPFAPTSLSEKADISYFNITLDAGDGGGGAAQTGQFIGEVNGAVGAEIRVYATDQLSFQSDSAQSMDASTGLGIMGFYYSS
jgi:hypothetical protein